MASARHHCKDCGLYFESSTSLDVHLHYHKDNLLSKWASQSQTTSDAGEHNNNTCNTLNHNKGGRSNELGGADASPLNSFSPPSGGSMKSAASTTCLPPGRPPSSSPFTSTNGTSPLYPPTENRFSPSFNYGDASANNGPSSAFSPVPAAGSPASSMLPPPDMRSPDNPAPTGNGYFSMEDPPAATYGESQFGNGNNTIRDETGRSMQSPSNASGTSAHQFRYHPYNGGTMFVSSGSGSQQAPGYAPSQCEKCGYLCDSPSALLDHINVCHQQQRVSPGMARNSAGTRASPAAPTSSNPQFISSGMNFFEPPPTPPPPPPVRIKTEQEAAEILDLDSHKVHVYQPPLDGKVRLPPNFSSPSMHQHPHAALLAGMHPQSAADKMYMMPNQSNEFIASSGLVTSTSELPRNNFSNHPGMQSMHMYQDMVPNQNPLLMPPTSNALVPQTLQGVSPHQTLSSLPHNNLAPNPHQFVHHHSLPMHQTPSAIQSNVAPPPPPINPGSGPPPGHPPGNQSWKSNEARRPKTYNCSACNKWFTSSGHLKRHYNTTLHKNALKQGAPDPAKEGPMHRSTVQSMPVVTGNDSSSTMTPSPAPSLGEESSSRSDDNTSFGRTTPATSQIPSMLPPSAASSPPNRLAGLLEAPTLAALGGTTPGGLQTPLLHHPFSTHSNSPVISSPSQLISHPSRSLTITSSSHSHLIHGQVDSHSSGHNGPHPHPPIAMQLQQAGLRGMSNDHAMSPLSNTGPPPVLTAITSSTNSTFDPYELHNGSLPPPLGQPQTYAPLTPLPSFAQFHHHAHHHFNPGTGSPSSIPILPPFSSMHSPFPSHPPNFLIADSAMTMLEHQVSSQPSQWSAFHHHQVMSPMLASSPVGGCNSESSNSFEGEPEIHIKEEIVPNPSPAPPPVTLPRRGSGRGRGSNRGHSRTPRQTVSSSLLSNGTPTTIHKCLDCDKVFNKACYLTQHNKSFHSGDKPFKCNTCGKRFPADYLYQEHLGKHAGEKPYKCEICPKQFNHKTDLRRHMCLHTGEKPYSCHVCGKGFIRKDHMLKHCETHRRKMSAAL